MKYSLVENGFPNPKAYPQWADLAGGFNLPLCKNMSQLG